MLHNCALFGRKIYSAVRSTRAQTESTVNIIFKYVVNIIFKYVGFYKIDANIFNNYF